MMCDAKWTIGAAAALLLGLASMGCTEEPRGKAGAGPQASGAAATGPAAVTAAGTPAKAEGGGCAGECGGGDHAAKAGGEGHGGNEGHECAGAGAATDSKVTEKKDPTTGATILAAGAALAGTAPAVKAADLLARPDEYAGKTVRLEGNVSAMCTHRRGWFAVLDEGDRAGKPVQVITAPAFLVPEGSIGKKARAEGVVEVTEIAPETARHYATGHQVGAENAAADKPVKAVVVRATGAEFI